MFCSDAKVYSVYPAGLERLSDYPYRRNEYLGTFWKAAIEADSKLIRSAVPGTFSGTKGKIIKLECDDTEAYVQQNYYKLFPANTLFYVSGPAKPVIAGIWENDKLHVIGFILPVRKLDKIFTAA